MKRKRSTGAHPLSLPFWDRLRSDDDFEVFCTELLLLNPIIHTDRGARKILEANRLAGGQPQKGADILGKASYGEQWVFQCKHVQSFGPGEVDEAIAKAEAGFPDAAQFVLVTTCVLGEPAATRLRARPRWMHWDDLRLTTIATQIEPSDVGFRLVCRHFGGDIAQRLFSWGLSPLVRWDEFFRQELSQDRRWFHHRTEYIDGNRALGELLKFARNPSRRAMVVSAAGGLGKSRLLLEFARRCDLDAVGRQVRLLNLGKRRLTEEERAALAREKDLLLIVDDAHRLRDSLEEVVAAVAESDSVLIVLATRPEGVEATRQLLFRCGFGDRIEETLALGHWDAEALESLARSALGRRTQLVTDIVQMAQGLPLLVVLAVEAHRSGHSLSHLTTAESFQDGVWMSFQDGFLHGMEGSRRERLERLIRLLAFVGPVPREHVVRLATDVEMKSVELEDDLDTLRTAGLTVENGEGIRLYPDLFADQVLLKACVEEGGAIKVAASRWLSRLSLEHYPALLRNVAQADWTAGSGVSSQPRIFDAVWQEFRGRFTGATQEERLGMVREWALVAVFQPQRTLELARWVLEEHRNSTMSADGSPIPLLPAILEPVAVWHRRWASEALDLLWELLGCMEPDDRPPGADPLSIIARAAGFEFHKPLDASKAVLEWMDEKLKMPEGMHLIRKSPHLLGALFRPFFERTFKRVVSLGRKVRFEWRSWPAPVARPVRQAALQLMERCLSSGNPVEALSLVPVLGVALQPVSIDQYDAVTDQHRIEWRPDRLDALAVVERLVPRFIQSGVVLLKLRKLLMDIVRREKDAEVATRMKQVLTSIPDTFELRILRALSSHAFEEIEVDRALEPEEWVGSREREWGNFCLGVARELVDRFGTVDAMWLEVRNRILEVRSVGVADQGGVLMGSICGLSRAWAQGVLNAMVTSRDEVLETYAGSVFQAAMEFDREGAVSVMDQVIEGNRVRLLVGLIEYLDWRHRVHGAPDSSEWRVWESLATNPNPEVLQALLRTLSAFFRSDANGALELIGRMEIQDGTLCDEAIRTVACLTSSPSVRGEVVARSLQALKGRGVSIGFSDSMLMRDVGQRFPVPLYEALKAAPEQPFDPESPTRSWEDEILIDGIALGLIDDEAWIRREVNELWETLQNAGEGGFEIRKCSSLIRGLMMAAGDPSRFVLPLLEKCDTTTKLLAWVRIWTIPESGWVFRHPEWVRRSLEKAGELQVGSHVEKLWCDVAWNRSGGCVEGVPDPVGQRLARTASDLAERYAFDSILGPFYRRATAFITSHQQIACRDWANADGG